MSDLSLSISIMAHEDRKEMVYELAEQIGDYTVAVAWDDGGGRWPTGRRAWKLYDPSCTHHLVLQDDAIVCRDFVPGVLQMLKHVPSKSLVSLYLSDYSRHRSDIKSRMTPLLAELKENNASFLVLRSLMGGVALLAPTYTIDEMTEFGDTLKPPNYDWRTGWYYHKLGWDTWYPWPSLVEHRHGKSLCNHPPVQAFNFIGADVSALDADWTGPIVLGRNAGAFMPAEPRRGRRGKAPTI